MIADFRTNALILLSAATLLPTDILSLSAAIAPSNTTGPSVVARELATPLAAAEPNPAIVPLDAPREPAIGPSKAIAIIPAAKAPTPTAAAPPATNSAAPPTSSSFCAINYRLLLLCVWFISRTGNKN